MIPPAPFFSLKIVLAIQGLLCFHTDFEIICTSSVENSIDVLIGLALNLYIAMGVIVILTIIITLESDHRENITQHKKKGHI